MEIAGIIAILKALPEFLKILGQVGNLITKLVEVSKKNDINKWLNDLEASIDQLDKAKTAEDKLKSARDLAKLIQGMDPK